MSIQNTPKDQADLEKAHALLESPAWIARVSDTLGKPVEAGMKKLPESANKKLSSAVGSALTTAAEAALWTMGNEPHLPASETSHKVYAALAGAVGGFGGLSAVALELPVSTTLMMRSIADIARSEGFDLTDDKTRAACIEVFALGGKSTKDDAGETGYYAVRTFMRTAIDAAAKELATATTSSTSSLTAKWVLALIQAVATRFGVVVTEKAILQSVPVIGAVTGATVNTLFMDHFQNMARGHFIVKRLEQKYGEADIFAAYDALKKRPPRPASGEVIDVDASEAKATLV